MNATDKPNDHAKILSRRSIFTPIFGTTIRTHGCISQLNGDPRMSITSSDLLPFERTATQTESLGHPLGIDLARVQFVSLRSRQRRAANVAQRRRWGGGGGEKKKKPPPGSPRARVIWKRAVSSSARSGQAAIVFARDESPGGVKREMGKPLFLETVRRRSYTPKYPNRSC